MDHSFRPLDEGGVLATRRAPVRLRWREDRTVRVRSPCGEESWGIEPYHDYFEKFVIPYYQIIGLAAPTSGTLEKAGDLRTYTTALRDRHDLRVIVNQNDFLLTDEDLAGLRATFTPEQLTVFEQGGHLSNLFNPAVQKTILGALEGLKAAPPKPD